MSLQKVSEFDPNYLDTFEGKDINGMSVYTQETNEKIGTVSDMIVDEQGQFRYLVVDLGFWIFGKKVLIPVGRSRIDYAAERVYTIGMNRQQAEDLPEYNENSVLDYDHEEQVRGVYRTQGTATSGVMTGAMATESSTPTYNRDTYTYQQDPSLYEMNEPEHETLKLYEERLIATKRRVKTGDVTISKHVETETQTVSVPIEKERVVIERITPSEAGTPVPPGTADFREGEVAHMEIYEETPDIRKEAFVREEVNVRKEVDRDVVEGSEQIRREELDIDAEGRTIEDRTGKLPNDRI